MTSQLCQQCSKIPFDQGLKTLCSPTYQGPMSWSLGTFGQLRMRSCPFCQLVAPMCSRASKSWHPVMPPDDSEEVVVKWDDYRGIFFSSHIQTSSRDVVSCICLAGTLQGRFPYCAREIFDEFIDFDDVRRWISKCDGDHTGSNYSCLPVPFNPAILPRIGKRQLDFRVIDVEEMCVVYAKPKCRYLALSYVWGARKQSRLALTSHNEDNLMRPGALTDNQGLIPNTIWDSMSVVRRLGERYLWVDSLCLVQDDAVELQECVAIMDLFYEMAILTIVAGDGDDAWAGLQGVEPTPRKINRPVRKIVPGLKMTTMKEMDSLLRRSTYSTRAWTMQEEVISHRILVFINGQIYFHCKASHFTEALNWAGKPLQDLSSSDASLYNTIFLGSKVDFDDFSILLMYYMLRKLSFQNDVLRAAQGMLRKFSVRSGVHCFEGLPPPLERSLLFQISPYLLEEGFGSLGRQGGFPSYSWTGWKSPSAYDGYIEGSKVYIDKNVEDNSESIKYLGGWIIWHCKLEDGKLFRITETGRLRKSLLLKPEDTIQNSRTGFQKIPIAVSDVDFSNLPSLSYPLLLFWTLCINLRLLRALPEQGHPHGLVNYLAIDKFGKSCGKVEMDTAIPESEYGKFALLAATEDAFWALMLVWKDGIAERRGVVKLSNSVLDGCLMPGPRWKAIVLG
ncbi:HET-domain-containing protein [Stipitochalara longipes BDJ]|nr:HET-domain-containing protein [Stipitochalara longipes BDJ]